LVKQPDAAAVGAPLTIASEAAFYSFCQNESGVSAVRAVVPTLVYFDPTKALLVMELIEKAVPLWTSYRNFEPSNFPLHIAFTLGETLATFHGLFASIRTPEDVRLGWLRHDAPWIMQIHKPTPELLGSISAANYQTLTILQNRENFSEKLDSLRPLWTSSTVIHGDIKSDNILVKFTKDSASCSEVFLVDWELVQIGDPAWDIAGVLQDFVLFWITSMTPASTIDEMIENGPYRMIGLHSGIRAFWRGYRSKSGFTQSENESLLARAIKFSGARLIQSAFEMAYTAYTLPQASTLLLQISSNLLSDSEKSQVQFYGLFQERLDHE
jgi:5-methylthioribose kinase